MQQLVRVSFFLFFSFFLNFSSSLFGASAFEKEDDSGYEADEEEDGSFLGEGWKRRSFRLKKERGILPLSAGSLSSNELSESLLKKVYEPQVHDYFEAAKLGQHWFLKQLEQEQFKGWEETDGEGYSALHRAAQYGHLEVIKFLLRKGLSPDLIAPGALSPYTLAWINEHEHCLPFLRYPLPSEK